MLRTQLPRLAVAFLMAVSISATFAALVAAVDDASYNEDCSTGRICIYRDSNLGMPLAATCGTCNDADYSNDSYPNNAGNLNDSMSSSVNYRSTGKVIWYRSANYSGTTPFCLNHGVVALNVGSAFNDVASSHLSTSGSC